LREVGIMRLAEVAEKLGVAEWRLKGALERQSIQLVKNLFLRRMSLE